MFDRRQFPAPDATATATTTTSSSSSSSSQIRDFGKVTAATPAYLWIVSEGNWRAQQIDAGRAYARDALAGKAAGLAMHPNEQALQEHP